MECAEVLGDAKAGRGGCRRRCRTADSAMPVPCATQCGAALPRRAVGGGSQQQPAAGTREAAGGRAAEHGRAAFWHPGRAPVRCNGAHARAHLLLRVLDLGHHDGHALAERLAAGAELLVEGVKGHGELLVGHEVAPLLQHLPARPVHAPHALQLLRLGHGGLPGGGSLERGPGQRVARGSGGGARRLPPPPFESAEGIC